MAPPAALFRSFQMMNRRMMEEMKYFPPRVRSKTAFDVEAFLATNGLRKKIIAVEKNAQIFSQGDPADSVFYIQKGKVKLTVVSKRGKEATIALLGNGDFVGEECIAAIQPQRMATATALISATFLRIERK
jgi:CRP/FNR family cyclic AMP-dependent transcriptional regulator